MTPPTDESLVEPDVGLIAFFDILGYKQIILNNDIHETAVLISDTLIHIPDNVIHNLCRDNSPTGDGSFETTQRILHEWAQILDEVEWLIFSDSILISLSLPPEMPPFHKLLRWVVFLQMCAVLLRRMFDAGFPLRGAISYGEFFVQQRCFAGKPIVAAYNVSSNVELSGCVLTEPAAELHDALHAFTVERGYDNYRLMLEQLSVEYLVPMKHEETETMRMLNWVHLPISPIPRIAMEARRYVLTSFLTHNKYVTPEIYPKSNNTEMFIRYLKTNLPIHPWAINSAAVDRDIRERQLLGQYP